MQTIYGIMRDCGDGSATIDWYRSKDLVDTKLDGEDYFMNEGSIAETLNFPDDLDLGECGFFFSDNDPADGFF